MVRRLVYRAIGWFMGSTSEPIWKRTLRIVGTAWVGATFTLAFLGYSQWFALMLAMPFVALAVLITKMLPPALGVAGLADDLGLIDLPRILDPVRIASTLFSGFSDIGWLVEVASGSAELAQLGFKRGLSLSLSGLKLFFALLKSVW